MKGRGSNLTRSNQLFWDELCGSDLARAVGVTERTPENLAKFDRAYLAAYPYLERYARQVSTTDGMLLEIGLGYGTLGQEFMDAGIPYVGVDIASGPVNMMRYRMTIHPGQDARVVQASALVLPFRDHAFTSVCAIGSLHHTGDLGGSIDEVRRVLRPGGWFVAMLYSQYSWRHLSPVQWMRYVKNHRRHGGFRRAIKAQYDTNLEGDVAPHIEFSSRRRVRALLAQFSSVRIEARNLGASRRFVENLEGVRKKRLLDTPIERAFGQDLYVIAQR